MFCHKSWHIVDGTVKLLDKCRNSVIKYQILDINCYTFNKKWKLEVGHEVFDIKQLVHYKQLCRVNIKRTIFR